MDDSSTASTGVVLAGLALVAAALPWATQSVGPVENPVLAVLGASAFGAFALRRHGRLARGPGALTAGVASLGIVAFVGVFALAGDALAASGLVDGTTATSPWAVALALAGGLGGVVAAYGDGRGLPEGFGAATTAAARNFAIGFAGLFAIAVWASVLVSLVSAVVPGELDTTVQLVVSSVALGFGTGTVALIYFGVTDRTRAYLDFRVPSLRDVGYVVAGTVAILGVQFVVSIVLTQLGMSTASHSVQQAAEGNAEVLLLLVPLSWLVIGPGEELLYRNIIQKNLYDTFGEWGGMLVASAVFALAHIPAYASGGSLPALLNTLAVIFVLALVLGTAYLKTGNATVAAAIHGSYDAVVFAAMYVQMTGGV